MVDLKVGSQSIKDVGLVIFDKDGTLMDLYLYWSNMVALRVDAARESLGFDDVLRTQIMYAMGVDLVQARIRREGPVGIKKRELVMAAMEKALGGAGFSDTHEICLKAFDEADQRSLEHLPQMVRPVRGAQELVGALHARGVRVAIATTDRASRARLAVALLGIEDKVDLVVGSDMVRNSKPHRDMAELVLSTLSMDRMSAVIVGDAVLDMEMGRDACLKASIAVCTGIAFKEDFAGKTGYIVEDLSHITVSSRNDEVL